MPLQYTSSNSSSLLRLASVVAIEPVAKDGGPLGAVVLVLGHLLLHGLGPGLEGLVGLQTDEGAGLQAGVGGQEVDIGQGHRVAHHVAAVDLEERGLELETNGYQGEKL